MTANIVYKVIMTIILLGFAGYGVTSLAMRKNKGSKSRTYYICIIITAVILIYAGW